MCPARARRKRQRARCPSAAEARRVALAGLCLPHVSAPPARPEAGPQVPGAVRQGVAAPGMVLRRRLRIARCDFSASKGGSERPASQGRQRVRGRAGQSFRAESAGSRHPAPDARLDRAFVIGLRSQERQLGVASRRVGFSLSQHGEPRKSGLRAGSHRFHRGLGRHRPARSAPRIAFPSPPSFLIWQNPQRARVEDSQLRWARFEAQRTGPVGML